jgi:hypothetical protein
MPTWVILLRGKRNPLAWLDDHSQSAWVRAYHLADLHNASIDESERVGIVRFIVVDGSNYYGN